MGLHLSSSLEVKLVASSYFAAMPESLLFVDSDVPTTATYLEDA